MRAYLLYLVVTSIFMDKSATYVGVVYLRYFDDLEKIHEYNWGEGACLVYLYSKLVEGCMWKIKQVTCNITLLTIIFLHLITCHFDYTFATLISTSFTNDSYIQFSSLNPLALPTHIRQVMCSDLH